MADREDAGIAFRRSLARSVAVDDDNLMALPLQMKRRADADDPGTDDQTTHSCSPDPTACGYFDALRAGMEPVLFQAQPRIDGVRQPKTELWHRGYDEQPAEQRNEEWPGRAQHLFGRDPGDACRDEQADPEGRMDDAEDQIVGDDHAEMDRIDSESFDDRQQDRREDQQRRHGFEKRPDHQQKDVDDEQPEHRAVDVERRCIAPRRARCARW